MDSRYLPIADHGFVGLVEVMGSDEAIEQAARVSYGTGTRQVSDTRNLIRYLMRHKHTSPFEMGEVKFHVKLPIFVMRQWVRHRTASLNEYSARYSVLSDEHYHPNHDDVQAQSATNRQGREGDLPAEVKSWWRDSCVMNKQAAQKTYEEALEAGIPRELARINLPVSVYTEMYWKIDLNNFMKVLLLRMDPHTQKETREYAWAMYELAKPSFPLSFEAFEDYMLNAVTLSAMERHLLENMLGGIESPAKLLEDEQEAEKVRLDYNFSKREWKDFCDKWLQPATGLGNLAQAAKRYKKAIEDGTLGIVNPNKPYGGPF